MLVCVNGMFMFVGGFELRTFIPNQRVCFSLFVHMQPHITIIVSRYSLFVEADCMLQ